MKNRNHKHCRFFLVTISSCFWLTIGFAGFTFGQSNLSPEREKVHLHLDKSAYAAGDTIWYKAYITLSGTHIPSSISRVIHVEFIDGYNRVTKSILLKMSTGYGWGDMPLPDTLKSGRYRIRAYSNWMRNNGTNTFFDKAIPILNKHSAVFRPQNEKAQTDTGKTDISFFPEGGDLVNGLRSKIAFKATGYDGRGENVSGEIIDQNKQVVAVFNTSHAGIGIFPLTPVAGKKYTAVVKFQDGSLRKIPLPVACTTGYVLTLNNLNRDSVLINIAQNEPAATKEVILIAQGDNFVYYSVKISLTSQRYATSIPRRYLPVGISRLTLLSGANEPLAERLLFNSGNDNPKLTFNTTKKIYTVGDRVTLDVKANKKSGVGLIGGFSIAVTNQDEVPADEEGELTIKANLLLTSDLKGVIERPNYYFIGKNAADSLQRLIHLDNLLLTQGWRTFVWEKNETGKPVFVPEDGLTISGKLLTLSQKPIIGEKVSIFAVIDGQPFLTDTLTGTDGRFKFTGLDFDNGTSFVVKAKSTQNNDNVKILIDTLSAPDVPSLPFIETESIENFNEGSKKLFSNIEQKRYPGSIQLKEVLIKAKKPIYSSIPGGRNFAYKVIDSDKIKGYINLRSVIEQASPFIRFNENNEPNYTGQRKLWNIDGFVTMIDGNLTSDNYALQVINPDDVESIEIHMNGLSVGVLNKGIIVINTKRHDPNYQYGKDKIAGVLTSRFNGYAKVRKFYAPQFPFAKDKPDLKDVIYWKPDVVTDNSGKAEISFYGGGNKGTYRAVLEGIGADGEVFRAVCIYQLN